MKNTKHPLKTKNIPSRASKSTSWQPVEKWYRGIVGEEGHYYHQKIVLPGVTRLLNLPAIKNSRILDIACGQGVLARHLGRDITYQGLDIAPSFIKSAKQQDHSPLHRYAVADVTKPFPLGTQTFTHAAIILALQNIEHPHLVFKNTFKHLENEGIFVIVLNHPCFRIPRQSSWQVDQEKKLQYRRLDRYYKEMQVPIQMNPSKGEASVSTLSFHHPLSTYTRWLKEAGFVIIEIEEWCSDKVSTGSAAKMENRSREEFPLFMTIVAKKTLTKNLQ